MSSSTLCSCELKPNPLEKGGIVSIIVGSDCDESAHMSSNNWLSINNPSTEEDEEDDDDELMKRRRPGQDEVWKAIQAQKQQGDNGDHNNNKAPPIRSTVSWSAIILSDQKVDVQDSVPYIHPLLKKSSSCCLSKQSLQICTESLGSETGSDCLTSQTRDSDHIQDQVQDNKQAHEEEEEEEEDIFNDVKIKNYSKKSSPSSFPPPLPSLANSSVQLRSHRQGKGEGEGGRLILEAVSVPQRNYFHAERSHGRLLLTALKSPATDDGSDEDEEEVEESSTTPSFNSNSNHLYWNSSSIAEYKQQQQQQEKEEGLIPLLRNCKEARRRSLLTWVPPNYCIATSS